MFKLRVGNHNTPFSINAHLFNFEYLKIIINFNSDKLIHLFRRNQINIEYSKK